VKRRQQFVTEAYYKKIIGIVESSREFWKDKILDEDYAGQGDALKAQSIKNDFFFALVLKYTAGEAIDEMPPGLERYIIALEQYQHSLAVCENNENISPLNIEYSVADYEEFIQVVSLCILLSRLDLLVRLLLITDRAGFGGDDLVYESLVSKVLPGRKVEDGWYHAQYTPLIDAIDSVTSGEAMEHLQDYCKKWYGAFKYVQTAWYDTHLTMTDNDGSYFGYWTFEAAAFSYLYDFDDSRITHLVYPKDLVEYARNAPVANGYNVIAKVYPGRPCPRAGHWFTPTQSNSRRLFEKGEIMPEFIGSPWDATIWYWSGVTD
jgi:hypothetical protein